MKRMLLMFVCGLLCLSSFGQYGPVKLQIPAGEKGYTIRGEVANAKDGMQVFLLNDMVWPVVNIDTVVIKDGKFLFTGYVEYPLLLKVVIDSRNGDEDGWLATAFYLENSDISFVADINTLQGYYYDPDATGKVPAEIKGSKEQDLFMRFEKEQKPLRDQKQALADKYFEYVENPANNIEGAIPMMQQMNENERAIRNLRLKYIRQNPGTGVAIDLLGWEIKNTIYINYTPQQLGQLEELMVKANPERANELRGWFARAENTAIGQKFPDMELKNTDGKIVKLSDYIPEGKYVIIDFWMSGCGPCRGETPHMKEVYEKFKDKGLVVISIAAEPEIKDWLKAVKEENMPWTQLYDWREIEDKDGIYGKFNIIGFPTCILLDREGHFFKTDMRGANMEIILQEIFGK